jgi:hypothetical protein
MELYRVVDASFMEVVYCDGRAGRHNGTLHAGIWFCIRACGVLATFMVQLAVCRSCVCFSFLKASETMANRNGSREWVIYAELFGGSEMGKLEGTRGQLRKKGSLTSYKEEKAVLPLLV